MNIQLLNHGLYYTILQVRYYVGVKSSNVSVGSGEVTTTLECPSLEKILQVIMACACNCGRWTDITCKT